MAATPPVADVDVLGPAEPGLGEAVHRRSSSAAYEMPRPGDSSRWCGDPAAALPSAPKRVEFTHLPRTTAGKVLKRENAGRCPGGQGAVVSGLGMSIAVAQRLPPAAIGEMAERVRNGPGFSAVFVSPGARRRAGGVCPPVVRDQRGVPVGTRWRTGPRPRAGGQDRGADGEQAQGGRYPRAGGGQRR